MTFVYVMPALHKPLCKVGFSKNPAARAARVAAYYAEPVRLHGYVSCNGCDPRQMEQFAHMFLKRSKFEYDGEWFAASPQECMWAIYKSRNWCLRRYRADGSFIWKKSRKTPEDFPLFVEASVWLQHWDRDSAFA